MSLPADETEISRLVRRCVNAPDERSFAQFRDELIGYHAPVTVEAAVRKQFRTLGQEEAVAIRDLFQDICNEAYVDLMQRLESIWKEGGSDHIEDLYGYSYAVAVNTFRKARARYVTADAKTKNRIKSLIDRSPELERWLIDDVAHCALTQHNRQVGSIDVDAFVAELKLEISDLTYFRLSKFVRYVLEKLGHGITVRQMASIAKEILVSERPLREVLLDLEAAAQTDAAGIEFDLEHGQLVEKVWQHIAVLPPKQRKALLLYASDGNGSSFVGAIFDSGVARLAEIAEALEIDRTECAHLMPSLPLSTDEIAAILGVEKGSVYDIRQTAERSLARRFAGVKKRNRA